MDYMKGFEIPELGADADVKIDGLSIKGIINVLINFINLIIKAAV